MLVLHQLSSELQANANKFQGESYRVSIRLMMVCLLFSNRNGILTPAHSNYQLVVHSNYQLVNAPYLMNVDPVPEAQSHYGHLKSFQSKKIQCGRGRSNHA